MDNQATKVIKAYLNPRHVELQLVKPHNQRVNAAERATQTFKNCFIGALGTQTPISLYNYGKSLPLKCRTPSIFFAKLASIPINQLTKPLKAPTAGSNTCYRST